MSNIHDSASKPGVASLLPLFLCASATLTIGVYTYVWTHDLTPKDAEVYTIVGTALSAPFGIAVAMFWRFFYGSLTRAAKKISASARPVSKRIVGSWVYNTLTLLFMIWSMVVTQSRVVIIFGDLVCFLSVFNLVQILKKNKP